MEENIRSILNQFHSKKKIGSDAQKSDSFSSNEASSSEIPDVFFDLVIHQFKINRSEIALLMYLYRQIWCRPNLYKSHGIGPLNSYAQMALQLHFTQDELAQNLSSLQNFGFIETVRSGQYFVRKYFTEELDLKYGQDYD